MLKRRMLQALIGIGLVAVSLLGVSGAANASPSGFTAKYVHANGTGSIGVEATGGISWYNRSVTLTSVRFYAHAGECGVLDVVADGGGTSVIDRYQRGSLCGYATTGRWYALGDIVLDGSAVSGGITQLYIYVIDSTHDGMGEAYCVRTAARCQVT